jgi:hypothetical protein
MSVFRQLGTLFAVCIALLGCATQGPRQASVATTQTRSSAALASPLFSLMPGIYQSTGESILTLSVERLDPVQPGSQTFRWTQTSSDPQQPIRQFQIGVVASSSGLSGDFSPLHDGQVSHVRCKLDWQVVNQSGAVPKVLAQTDDRDCRFVQGEEMLLLQKEIAFDGARFQIADQIVPMSDATSEVLSEAVQFSEFVRIRPVRGWAGRRDGDEWRIASEVALKSDGSRIAPSDAAGMSLGLGVSIRQKRVNNGLQWRLVVSELDTGEVIGQAWANEEATRIGWANEHIQIELNL